MLTRKRGRTLRACATGLALLVFSGCAYVTAVPAPPGSNVRGIRIYDVKPILIVSGSSTKVEIIPNYNRAYALRFGAFLAKNDFQASFSNGIISQVHANMDSTEFIKVLTELIKHLPTPGTGLSVQEPGTPAGGLVNRFQVYDFVFSENGELLGLKPLIATSDLRVVNTAQDAGPGKRTTVVKKGEKEDDEIKTGKH